MYTDTGDLRPFRFDLLREGDLACTRSDKIISDIIAYAEAWGPGKDGRARARAAVRDPQYPNHVLSDHEAWGQHYPVEASPRGYVRGDYDDYRVRDCRIVAAFRWAGFDDPVRHEHCAHILERWARKATRPAYDWWGAVLSSPLGRAVFGRTRWHAQAMGRLYCSEGALTVLAMCGLGEPGMPGECIDVGEPLANVSRCMDAHPEWFPKSRNPVDVLLWARARADMMELPSLYKE